MSRSSRTCRAGSPTEEAGQTVCSGLPLAFGHTHRSHTHLHWHQEELGSMGTLMSAWSSGHLPGPQAGGMAAHGSPCFSRPQMTVCVLCHQHQENHW